MRLFVALPLPVGVLKDLARLCSGLPGARWVAPENMHVTLRFIGEIDPPVAEEVDDLLSHIDAPAFEFRLAGLGTFGSRGRVRALWAGIEKSAPLERLQAKIEAACVRTGPRA